MSSVRNIFENTERTVSTATWDKELSENPNAYDKFVVKTLTHVKNLSSGAAHEYLQIIIERIDNGERTRLIAERQVNQDQHNASQFQRNEIDSRRFEFIPGEAADSWQWMEAIYKDAIHLDAEKESDATTIIERELSQLVTDDLNNKTTISNLANAINNDENLIQEVYDVIHQQPDSQRFEGIFAGYNQNNAHAESDSTELKALCPEDYEILLPSQVDRNKFEWTLRVIAGYILENKGSGTALHIAISRRNEKLFKLLERGADVNAVHKRSGTPLQEKCSTARDYSTRFIKILSDRSADLNVLGARFGTALQAACAILSVDDTYSNYRGLRPTRLKKAGDNNYATSIIVQNIQLLIDYGADVNIQGGEYGTALHALARVIEPGTAQLVKQILDKGARVDQLSDAGLGTALHVASHEGMAETVRVLLDHGADVNAAGSTFGTPLQAAVGFSWRFSCPEEEKIVVREIMLETVHLLIQRGANINQKGGRYGTALHVAYANPNVDAELLSLLLNHGADVSVEGGQYGTMLVAACSNPERDLESVHLLLNRGVDVNAGGKRYRTAPIAACSHDHLRLDLVRVLIDRGADVNAKGGEYGSALIAACRHGHLELLPLLLDRGADMNAKSARGQTALINACSRRPRSPKAIMSSVKLLLKGGADVNAEDKDGKAPLMLACRYGGGLELVQLLLENGANVFHQDCAAWHEVLQQLPYLDTEKEVLPILELFYDYHIDVNHVHKQHGTALNAIGEIWQLFDGERELHPCIRWLLDHGADINIIGGDLGFPLQAACVDTLGNLFGISDIDLISGKTKLLLKECPDIDVNAQGGQFGSALQAASFSGQTESVKLLTDKKANVNAAGGKYGSALSAAIISGHWDIVEILLQAGATPDSHLQRQPDEEWLEEIQKNYKQRAVERYKKFWEVQGMSSLDS
ncbi:ankyrin repeat-containing domain protein [Trichoderma chlorosporum]